VEVTEANFSSLFRNEPFDSVRRRRSKFLRSSRVSTLLRLLEELLVVVEVASVVEAVATEALEEAEEQTVVEEMPSVVHQGVAVASVVVPAVEEPTSISPTMVLSLLSVKQRPTHEAYKDRYRSGWPLSSNL
jgi:hypothetical protein